MNADECCEIEIIYIYIYIYVYIYIYNFDLTTFIPNWCKTGGSLYLIKKVSGAEGR